MSLAELPPLSDTKHFLCAVDEPVSGDLGFGRVADGYDPAEVDAVIATLKSQLLLAATALSVADEALVGAHDDDWLDRQPPPPSDEFAVGAFTTDGVEAHRFFASELQDDRSRKWLLRQSK